MTELDFHRFLVWAMFGTAVVTFGYLLRRPAPYGRHYAGSGWGPTVSSKVGWVVMESLAVLFFGFVFFQGEHTWGIVPLVFLAMWQLHYLNRTLISRSESAPGVACHFMSLDRDSSSTS